METVYDWITVALFGALVVLFLLFWAARKLVHSTQTEHQDTIYHYLPPAVGCAVANYVGNDHENYFNGYGGPISAAIVVAVLIYVVLVLRPFGINLLKRD